MKMCYFRTQNGSLVPNKVFLVQTIIINFIYLLAFFIVQNFKKILTADPELWGCTILGPKMVHLPYQTFFWKIFNIILIYLLAPFTVQNFKKLLTADWQLWGSAIFAPKMALCPNENFFRKAVNEPSFFQSCLSICQKLKSDINPLVKYWQLKNTEISLTESHFWL